MSEQGFYFEIDFIVKALDRRSATYYMAAWSRFPLSMKRAAK